MFFAEQREPWDHTQCPIFSVKCNVLHKNVTASVDYEVARLSACNAKLALNLVVVAGISFQVDSFVCALKKGKNFCLGLRAAHSPCKGT